MGPAIEAHKAGVKAYLLSAAAIAAAVAFVSGAYNESAGLDWPFVVVALAALVPTLALVGWILSLRISFHERGVSFRSGARCKEMPWEEVEHFYYKARRQRLQNIPFGTTYKFRLRGRDGKTISFGNLFVNVVSKTGAVGQKLIEYSGPPLLEKMRAEHCNGGTLTLGPLRFGQTNGLSWANYLHHLPFPLDRLPRWFGESRLALDEVAESLIVDGYLCLIKPGELRPRVRFAVSKVPNVFVLKDFLNEVRPTQQPIPEAKRGLVGSTGNRLKRFVVGTAVRFEGKLIVLLLACVLAGPGVAYLGWSNGQRHQDVNRRGIETIAAIEGGQKSTWKSVDTYSLNLAWKDQSGAERHAKDVALVGALSNKIIKDDQLLVGEVRIKYLADDASVEPILVESIGDSQDDDKLLLYGGMGAAGMGVVGFALLYLLRRISYAVRLT